MKGKLLILILCIFFRAHDACGQTFTDLNNGFLTLTNASVSWGDYDNDTLPDFALIGFSGVSADVSQIFHNDGGGNFSLVHTLSNQVFNGAVSWGDYDHDGDLDLLANGQTSTGPLAATTLVRNDGGGIFTEIASPVPGVIGVARWIDFDGDGWLDIVTCGYGSTLSNDSTRLFHNDTTGTFSEISSGLPGFNPTDISVVDFDNDGDMDFFMTGGTISTTTNPVAKLYVNNGSGVFSESVFQFMNLSTGTSKWADFDNDGDMDLLYDGIDTTFVITHTLLYRNDSAGNFTLLPVSLPGSGEPGSVDCADVDNDGDLDILLGGPTTLLRNDGSNTFTDITPPSFPDGVPNTFIDFDNDGDNDILFVRMNGGFTATTIFRNEMVAAVAEANNFITDIFISPNPATTTIFIERNTANTPATLQLLDCYGRKVEEIKIAAGEKRAALNIKSFAAGIYFVRIADEKEQVVRKVVVQR